MFLPVEWGVAIFSRKNRGCLCWIIIIMAGWKSRLCIFVIVVTGHRNTSAGGYTWSAPCNLNWDQVQLMVKGSSNQTLPQFEEP